MSITSEARISVYFVKRTFRQYYDIEVGEYFISIHGNYRKVEVLNLDAASFRILSSTSVDVTRIDKEYVASVHVSVELSDTGLITKRILE